MFGKKNTTLDIPEIDAHPPDMIMEDSVILKLSIDEQGNVKVNLEITEADLIVQTKPIHSSKK